MYLIASQETLVNVLQESRAIAQRTARCRCKFRYVSNFTITRWWNVYVGNSVDADASGAKSGTKYLESRLEVIQGHAFWDHWKATRACVLYNSVRFGAGNLKEMSEHLRFR